MQFFLDTFTIIDVTLMAKRLQTKVMKSLLVLFATFSFVFSGCITTKESVFGDYEYSTHYRLLNVELYQDSSFRLINRIGLLMDTISGTYSAADKRLILNSYINEFNTKAKILLNNCDTCKNNIPVQVKDLLTHDVLPARITLFKDNKIITVIDCNFEGRANLFHSSVDSILVDFLGYESFSSAIDFKSDISIQVYLISSAVKRNMINNENWRYKKNSLVTPAGHILPAKVK